MNSHPWATGKVTIQDSWPSIGGSFSGGSEALPSRSQKQQERPHFGRNICSTMHNFEALDVSGAFKKVTLPPVVCINYCKNRRPHPHLSVPGLSTVILKKNVLLGSGQRSHQ